MKKLITMTMCLSMTALLVACGGESKEYKPALDPETTCEIKVVGDYSNFEALEAEFDKFNEFYPHVSLSYEKIDDYTNNLATVLAKEDALISSSPMRHGWVEMQNMILSSLIWKIFLIKT